MVVFHLPTFIMDMQPTMEYIARPVSRGFHNSSSIEGGIFGGATPRNEACGPGSPGGKDSVQTLYANGGLWDDSENTSYRPQSARKPAKLQPELQPIAGSLRVKELESDPRHRPQSANVSSVEGGIFSGAPAAAPPVSARGSCSVNRNASSIQGGLFGP